MSSVRSLGVSTGVPRRPERRFTAGTGRPGTCSRYSSTSDAGRDPRIYEVAASSTVRPEERITYLGLRRWLNRRWLACASAPNAPINGADLYAGPGPGVLLPERCFVRRLAA